MTSYVITPPRQAAVAVKGRDELFPVRRVYCIGRNYADHAIEMGHDPDRELPFFFQKNADNVNSSGEFPYPAKSSDVHHEIELVVALKSGGVNIRPENALEHVYGYAVGIDMTRRDLQAEMKAARRPWEIGKAFEQSAPVGPISPASEVGHCEAGSISLSVNDETRQQGNLNQMIWKLPEIIAYLSEYYEIGAGDLIMTGTPAGVGPVDRGDVMVGKIEGIGELVVKVV